jgi:cyclomaltodextrinase
MQPRLLHQPYEPYAYALDKTTARIVLLIGRGSALSAAIAYADRYQQDLTEEIQMEWVGEDGVFDVFRANVKIATSRLKYTFVVLTKQTPRPVYYGESGIHTDPERAGVFQLAYLSPRDVFNVPEWSQNAVCYQIFPERFCSGNDALTPPDAASWDSAPTRDMMLGGDLPGIRSKLDYLQDLGVSLIYLTPIFKARSNHKYDTADYYEIDPQFGTKTDLRHLVEDAHHRGIRIVLDAVFNHSGPDFSPFQNVLAKGHDSRYWDWFFIHGDFVDTNKVNYETFSNNVWTMPKLNVGNPEVETYLLDVATYWVREFDIDGWRLDVANEVDHVFWRKFRQAVKQVKADALIIGEVWHNSLPWLRGDQFDGVMNYLFREYGLDFLVDKVTEGTEFARHIVRLLYLYPEQSNGAQFNLLGSHDTERILTYAQGDKRAVLRTLAYLFTFPGIPMLYYGDEVGMEGDTDPDCRKGMAWDDDVQDLDLKAAVRQLAQLKRTHPALHTTDLRIVKATRRTVEYQRRAENGQVLHVAFNTGQNRARLDLDKGKILFESEPRAIRNGTLAPGACVIWEP